MVANDGLGFLSVTNGRERQMCVVSQKVQESSVDVVQEMTRGIVGVGDEATKVGWAESKKT